jgi:hypothetical protein
MLDHFAFGREHEGGLLPLGPEYLLTMDDHLVLASQSSTPVQGPVQHAVTPIANSPASSLIGSSNGLQINLVWDQSVRSNSNWAAIEAAVTSAAQIYTSTFSNHMVINIAVGYGEVAGQLLGANALGESESNGYITNYATTASALSLGDAGLVHAGLMSASAAQSLQGLKGESFFVTSAEAKALGLTNGSSTGIDGYIGLTASSAMFFPGAGGAIKANQYDAIGVAAHEISEVMGRIGMEGQKLGSYANVYTPLDMFRFTAPNTPDIRPTAGYFSTNNGLSNLEAFNNPGNGGDAADWASSPANALNAFDAFDNPGVKSQVTATDLLEIAALGFQIASGHILTTVTA